MSLRPNSSHFMAYQFIVNAIENIYSVISTCVNRVDFLISFLPKWHYSRVQSYRDLRGQL